MKQANDNHNNFSEFRDNATDPTLKNSSNNCVGFYQEMLDDIKMAYQLSQQGQYKNITQLAQVQTLAYDCEHGMPSNSPTAAISETMILTGETSTSVNLYMRNTGQWI